MMQQEIKLMELPRIVFIGSDAISQVLDICHRLHLKGCGQIVCDKTTQKIAGKLIEDILTNGGYEIQTTLISDATLDDVNNVRKEIKYAKLKFVIGVGGGRPIDVAKYSAHLEAIPFLSVPTAASHDGIASPQVSIRNPKNKVLVSKHASAPVAIIADTSIVAQSPYRLLVAGCGDIIAKLTAVKDWELAKKVRGEYYSSYAAALSEMTAKLLIKNVDTIKPGEEASARFVLKALVSSGVAICIAGSSRPASGSEHLFSHALDKIAVSPALHGEQCGVGAIMMMYLHGGDWKAIKNTLAKIGAPTSARELNISPSEIIKALRIAHTIRPRYTILGDKGLTQDAAEEVAKVTEIIS